MKAVHHVKRIIWVATLLSFAWSCGQTAKQNGDGKTDKSPISDASAAPSDVPAKTVAAKPDPVKTAAPADPAASTPTAPPFNVAALVGKLTWNADFYNNQKGQAYTGFDGQNVFIIPIDVEVYEILPAGTTLTDDQYDVLYESPEYLAAAKAEVAKISLTTDTAFLTSKMGGDYEVGRVYELTSVKAGTTTVTAKYGATTLPPITVTITPYTAAQVAAGKQRFTTAVTGATPSPACAACHTPPNGVDNSPYFEANYPDAGILSFVATGVNSDDGYKSATPHVMTFTTPDQKAGIVAYLRSIN